MFWAVAGPEAWQHRRGGHVKIKECNAIFMEAWRNPWKCDERIILSVFDQCILIEIANDELWTFYFRRRALPRASTAFIVTKFIRFFGILHTYTIRQADFHGFIKFMVLDWITIFASAPHFLDLVFVPAIPTDISYWCACFDGKRKQRKLHT
jgi:hypothetical protein